MTRILIADDSELVRRGIEHLLAQHEGWEVCGEAVDGEQAVQKARDLAPDVVVIDFSMPVLNGIDAARQIMATRPETRIVLCSMYLDTQLASIASEAGIRIVLSKEHVGQVVQGIEAALTGNSFCEAPA